MGAVSPATLAGQPASRRPPLPSLSLFTEAQGMGQGGRCLVEEQRQFSSWRKASLAGRQEQVPFPGKAFSAAAGSRSVAFQPFSAQRRRLLFRLPACKVSFFCSAFLPRRSLSRVRCQ